MMEKSTGKMHGEEEGGTLMELMMVVMISGIFVAIDLLTSLDARRRA